LAQLDNLKELQLGVVERETRRQELQRLLNEIESALSSRVSAMESLQIQRRGTSLLDIGHSLPPNAALVDLVYYFRFDFQSKTNDWNEARYAAYLTFPLTPDATNPIVAMVDLGEAAPIDVLVDVVSQRMSAGQFANKNLSFAMQQLSELVYAPLARHLTNVSHLIVCPDGQLSRVPFEMLLVSGRGEPPRYLVEEKTVSYVGSGREVVRLQGRSGFQPDPSVQKGAVSSTSDSAKATPVEGSGQAGSVSYVGPSVVMGNPDFDFALPRSSRREEALTNAERGVRNAERKENDGNVRPHPGPDQTLTRPAATLSQPMGEGKEREKRPPPIGGTVGIDQGSTGVSPYRVDEGHETSAATRSLSRSYRGMKFARLPGSEAEATNVARLLGGDTVLRLGAEAREAELKAVVSPRVLHLATHGFFLTDQEFKRTNAGPALLSVGLPAGRRQHLPENDWENPMVRCGIALAGANHATNLTSRSSRREEALILPKHNQSEQNAHPHPGQEDLVLSPRLRPQPQEREKHSPRSAEVDRPVGSDATNSQSLLTSAATRFEVEDGLLTGLEASLLNLQGTELVILSACESGAGEVKIGEGVMSLRRAFRIAGAETVLASHWKVNDQATSRLMTEFMSRWRAGEPRAKAWREAQLTLLRSKEYSNPYFWAAFTLTGQWR
jgi:CHAT domain-containing protein